MEEARSDYDLRRNPVLENKNNQLSFKIEQENLFQVYTFLKSFTVTQSKDGL